MPRLYENPVVEENPITGREVTKIRLDFDGNKLGVVVIVEEGFIKVVDGIEKTNDVGLPLWKIAKTGTRDQRSRGIGDAAFADKVDAHWDILTTAGTPKIRRLVSFLMALGWEVVDMTPPGIGKIG